MYPELFEIPFVHLTVWSYGVMMVIGFISAVYLIRRLSREMISILELEVLTNKLVETLKDVLVLDSVRVILLDPE